MSAFVLILCIATVAALPTSPSRIVGGTVTSIEQYPSMVALLLLYEWGLYGHMCGGSILNNRSVLTAAHCVYDNSASKYQIRVGSTWAHSGGVVHRINGIIMYDDLGYPPMIKHDIGIIRSASNINFNEWTHPAPIAGTTYVVPDNDHIWAVGWGARYYGEVPDPQELRHVKVMKYNMDECKKLYKAANFVLPADYMVCAGWPTHDRSQCYGDSGSPIFHHGTVVGVASAAVECGQTGLPAINIRVANFTNWIIENA